METLLLTLDEGADHLRVSTRTVRRMLERGELPSIRIGRSIRIPTEAVKTWVDLNMKEAHNQMCAEPSVRKGGNRTCHISAKIVPFGGPRMSTQAEKELDALLGQPTEKRPKP